MSTTSKRVFERSKNPNHEAEQLQKLQNALAKSAKNRKQFKNSFDSGLKKLGKIQHQW